MTKKKKFDIVIASKDRPELVKRAIKSGIVASFNKIIIVDDGSFCEERYKELITIDERIEVIRLQSSMGPGPARQRGLISSTADYTLILDDDDEVEPDCISSIEHCLNTHDVAEHYPVIHFGTSTSNLSSEYRKISANDLICQNVRVGDFAPLINNDRLHEIKYPETRVGMEGALWLVLAEIHGIPTFSTPVIKVNNDGENRLTNFRRVVDRAAEYMAAQIIAMDYVKNHLAKNKRSPAVKNYLSKKKFTTLAYYLLIKNPTIEDRNKLKSIGKVYWLISKIIPAQLARYIFSIRRK